MTRGDYGVKPSHFVIRKPVARFCWLAGVPAGRYTALVSKYDLILDCAEQLIRKDGAAQLTLEKVAERAKVSKGGLLYHFPTKEQLVVGMIERTIDSFERDIQSAKASLPEGAGRNTLAFMMAALDGQWKSTSARPTPVDLLVSTLTAFATEPQLVLPIRKAYVRWQRLLEEDGLDPVQATITRLAIDGLIYTEMFGFNDFTEERRQAVLGALRRMCVESNSSHPASLGRGRKSEKNK
jgi:AcrR family transcriptional regulator